MVRLNVDGVRRPGYGTAMERDLVALLAGKLGVSHPDVWVGIGDDAAVLAPSSQPTVLSVDASIEGVHFRRSFAALDVLAERALTAALSDLAAMGARPRAALSSLVLERGDPREVEAIAEGLARGAARYGCPIVGGNLARGPVLELHTTVIGAGGTLRRRGARVGDALWVSGTVGSAALGLEALLAERTEGALAPFVARWRAPRARFDVAERIAATATAAMDLSDGLAADAPRLAEASGVGLVIEVEALPREPGHDEAARVWGLDPLALAYRGGEDYELVFTLPDGAVVDGATRIGRVVSGSGVVVTRGGSPLPSEDGFDHFALRASRSRG